MSVSLPSTSNQRIALATVTGLVVGGGLTLLLQRLYHDYYDYQTLGSGVSMRYRSGLATTPENIRNIVDRIVSLQTEVQILTENISQLVKSQAKNLKKNTDSDEELYEDPIAEKILKSKNKYVAALSTDELNTLLLSLERAACNAANIEFFNGTLLRHPLNEHAEAKGEDEDVSDSDQEEISLTGDGEYSDGFSSALTADHIKSSTVKAGPPTLAPPTSPPPTLAPPINKHEHRSTPQPGFRGIFKRGLDISRRITGYMRPRWKQRQHTSPTAKDLNTSDSGGKKKIWQETAYSGNGKQSAGTGGDVSRRKHSALELSVQREKGNDKEIERAREKIDKKESEKHAIHESKGTDSKAKHKNQSKRRNSLSISQFSDSFTIHGKYLSKSQKKLRAVVSPIPVSKTVISTPEKTAKDANTNIDATEDNVATCSRPNDVVGSPDPASLPIYTARSPSRPQHSTIVFSQPRVQRMPGVATSDPPFSNGNDEINDVYYDPSELNNLLNFYNEIDVLLNGNDNDKKMAYKKLLLKEKLLNCQVSFLWRMSRACFAESIVAKLNGRWEQHKQLMFNAKDYAFEALKIDSTNCEVHKWCAITIGSIGEFEGVNIRIKNGFKFKEHIDIAIELCPLDASAQHLKGRWCYEVAQLSWMERKAAATIFSAPPTSTIDEALRCFVMSENLKPTGSIDNQMYLAKCYIEKKDIKSAIEWLKKARALETKGFEDEKFHEEIDKLLYKWSSYA